MLAPNDTLPSANLQSVHNAIPLGARTGSPARVLHLVQPNVNSQGSNKRHSMSMIGRAWMNSRVKADRLHHGQFIIGEQPIHFHPECDYFQLSNGLWLSCHPQSLWQCASSKDRVHCVLFGKAIHLDSTSATSDIERSTAAEISESYGNWCGRWALLIADALHLDASGMLSIFYLRDQRGQFWLSSSPALLAHYVLEERERTVPSMRGRGGIDWIPGPLTRFRPIRRLLPSQTINVRTGAVSSSQLTRKIHLSQDERVGLLRDTLVHACRNVAAQTTGRIWLPLTGGLDSRVLLAACSAAQIEVTAYTQLYPFIDHGDVDLPPALAAIAGYKHLFIRPQNRDRSLLKLYDSQGAGHSCDQDREFFARRQWDFASDGDLVLRGTVFEIGRCYFWRYFPENDGVAAPPPDRISAARHCSNLHCRSGMSEWHEWTQVAPEPDMDWRDRFYVEQRLASWMASIEQTLDLTGTIRIPIANSRLFRDLVLGFDPLLRKHGIHQSQLIEQLYPSLLTLPVNPKSSLGVRIGNRLLRDWHGFWQ